MIPNYLHCSPSHPDAKCNNCKRPHSLNKTSVYVKNSKDKACIYIPISLQDLPSQRNQVLEEVAIKLDQLPFGDTAASYAAFVRGMKS